MSIFDTEALLKSSKKKIEFFHRSQLPVHFKKVLLECEIFFQKQNGSLISYFLKLADHKFVLYKDFSSGPRKYIDLKEIFTLGSCLDSHQKRNPDYSFYFTFEKANISKFFFLNDYHTFEKIMAILKNYCIMRNFNKKYEIIQYLGRGHFAEVFSAKNKANKQIYAVKIFQKKTEKFQKNQSFIIKEIRIQMFLPDCPFIIKLFEVYENQEEVVMILELMEGEDLFRPIKAMHKLSETQIYGLFSQILKGLLFLQSHGVVHRDLKPDNILLSDKSQNPKVKISDFSLADELEPKGFQEFCGTPGYIAPEIFSRNAYDEKVDVFSFGVILYMMFIGKPIFRGKDCKVVLQKNKEAKIPMRAKEWANVSQNAKKLVKKMLYKDPERRIKLQDICNDKWIKQQRFQYKSLQSTLETKTITLENPHSDIIPTINNITNNNGSVKNFLSFKNSFLGRKNNKSNTDIIFNKKKLSIFSNSNFNLPPNNEEEDKNNLKAEDESVNHSKYLMETKFLQDKPRNSALLLPTYLENYSVNSFLIRSKSDINSELSSHNNLSSEEALKTQQTKFRKTSINSSNDIPIDNNNSPNSYEDILKGENNSESLIFEIKDEEFEGIKFPSNNQFETRVIEKDVNLAEVVPLLVSLRFKSKNF